MPLSSLSGYYSPSSPLPPRAAFPIYSSDPTITSVAITATLRFSPAAVFVSISGCTATAACITPAFSCTLRFPTTLRFAPSFKPGDPSISQLPTTELLTSLALYLVSSAVAQCCGCSFPCNWPALLLPPPLPSNYLSSSLTMPITLPHQTLPHATRTIGLVFPGSLNFPSTTCATFSY